MTTRLIDSHPNMPQPVPKTIIIVGGSLSGLFAGVALKRLHKNLNIRIFERNPTPLLRDQGAGIVAGQDVQTFFSKNDRTKTPLAVTSRQRLYLDRDGNVIHREDSVQQMTSWDLLYHLLRVNFDGVESEYAETPGSEEEEGTASYEYGCTVTGIKTPDQSSSLNFSEPVEVTMKRHSGETFSATADLVIAADGASSIIRPMYFPDIKRKYAGYVGWRGLVPENKMSEAAAAVFTEKFVFYHTEGIQTLTYLIPGKNGTIEPGKRFANLIWYQNYPEGSPEHTELMTDKNGKKHHVSLPPGAVSEAVWSKTKENAKKIFPPQFVELLENIEVPFLQVITDAIAPSAVLSGGRVLLMGDALANFRPHTAASTNQGALDAMALAEAVKGIFDGEGMKALNEWEDKVGEYARNMQKHGVQIGNRSQFGEHPLKG
jgi:2-polyprenyl-6-methoxyphenol hydroxylase-like FAD-dependent oxidoreductase